MPGSRGAIVGATSGDSRDVLVEGDSGLQSFYPNGGLNYEPSKRRVTWPNGSRATLFSADEPGRLRGPQFHWAIADELAIWRRLEAWDNLLLGLRLGDDPRLAVGTTPKPLRHIKALIADPTVAVTRGTTYENRDNLADAFFTQVIGRYEGTRLGRQELYGDILDDVPGALWSRQLLDEHRVSRHPDLYRVVVGVDPQASTGQTGIVVVGVARHGDELHGYTLDDATPPAGVSPAQWGLASVAAYHKWGADLIVGEVNNGGDMVENVIRNVEGGRAVRFKAVRATRGKYVRAEPVAAIMEQGRDHHVGLFPELEDELCGWLPGDESPNRLDAKVWAYTELMVGEGPTAGMRQAHVAGRASSNGRRTAIRRHG
jgi:phage terminase large subunit-like protein